MTCSGFEVTVRVGMAKFCPGPYLPEYHKFTSTTLMVICFFSFYKASTVPPGVIENKEQALRACRRYPYDDVMFSKNNSCTTCKFVKPARSKHCVVCDHCVEKFDHHCIWVNQCIGIRNFKWFLLYLFLHIILCIYAVYGGIAAFLGEKLRKE